MNVVENCSHVVFTTKNVQKIKEQMEKFSLILVVASSEAAAELQCTLTGPFQLSVCPELLRWF